MLAMSPEKRCRQKLRRRMRDDANPETALEYFQVSVNIIEAKNLAWSNLQTVNSHVVVMLGKQKYRTSIRKKMEDPCYREYLLFEWKTTLQEVQRSSLWIGVMESRCCAPLRILGETSIDLGAIWAQPNHQVFHKWAQLSLPRNPAAGTVGFLKVDISIKFKGDHIQFVPVVVTPERFEKNFLPSASEQQNANYVITVYNAFGISSRYQEQGDRRQAKLPSTYVKVSFCGISAKTAVQARSSNPSYNERISIADIFPTMCQTVHFEVCSALPSWNQLLARVDLNLSQISHDGDNGFVPTFGPSLLHMYGNAISRGIETPDDEGPIYNGALLVALKAIVPHFQQNVKITNVEPIAPIDMSSLWTWEDFCIICPILEISMLDHQRAGKCCGAAITIGEMPFGSSINEDFLIMKKTIKKRKLHYTGPIEVTRSQKPYGHLDFAYAFPVLQQTTRLPGFRFRIYRNNLIQRIAEQLETSLCDVESRLNNFDFTNPSALLEDLSYAVNVASENIVKCLEILPITDPSVGSHGDTTHYYTELDQKQQALQKKELEKIYQQINEKIKQSSTVKLMKLVGKPSGECYSVSKKNVKMLLVESIKFAEKLKSLVFKSTEGWPDIVIWLLNDGSRFAFHKICTSDVLFSEIPKQRGKDCGRIQTLYLKPFKCLKHLNTVPSCCDCISGKIELIIWMGLYSDLSHLDCILPQGLRIKTKEYDMCVKASILMVQCRVYIYRAKLMMNDTMTPPSPLVRINVLNSVRETQAQQKTTTPVWDQVLTVSCMVRTSQDRIALSPPEVMVEIYNQKTAELIGRLKIQPAVDNTRNAEYAPKLKWHNVCRGLENTGQILMSALVRQVPETLVKSTLYTSLNVTGTSQDVPFEAENNSIEELPRFLKPKNLKYKIDVYWWGLRDVGEAKKPCAVMEIDDLVIKSDVIAETRGNCNFPNGQVSQIFEGHLDKTNSLPLTIKLYDSSTFGRIIFLGTNAAKNPNKYLVEWLPKYERELSLRNVSFSSSMFYKANKSLYIKKCSKSSESTTDSSKMNLNSCLVDKKKWPPWKKLFCRDEPDEEKYALLPITMKKTEQYQTANIVSDTEYQDWWSRFFSSLKECGDNNEKIKIYNSELERQPEFSKFKDWCSTLKLYNGKKTGIPDKDEGLSCGLLKAGIAIYRWPPSPDTVAVSLHGVELQRGFFADFPCNDPSKYLVRVYIIRGLNFTNDNGNCNPYVVIKSGAKELGDRNHFEQNTVNPVFGRTYEIWCSLPEDYLLTVAVYNHVPAPSTDAIIGATTIDIEDRIYSKHRGRLGISTQYKVMGVSKWRDTEKPSDILAKLCIKNHMRPPTFPDGNTVLINEVEYRDADMSNKTYISASERKENICLSLIHNWHTLPLCGYHLVPEHVETRQLINLEKPDVDQGKIQMWIDIFPLQSSTYVPMPIDITPRKVEDYELRVIIWQVRNFMTDSLNAKQGLDLYVKAWIGHVEKAHYTDIHYNSINGEASFNWRMIFNLQYQHSDKKLVIMEKGPFTECGERLPPILVVQVVDIDSEAESINDYLATLMLDLNAVPCGSEQSERISLDYPENSKKINIFSARSLRSWWPLKKADKNTATVKFAGMIDLELHLVPKQKAILMPVGLGRDAPFPLPEPNRPDTTIKAKSSIMESIFHRGGAEYFAGAILLVVFIATWYWGWPSIMFAYFYD